MIDFNITDEEWEALKNYEEKNYEAINQMRVSDAETDIALLSSEVENKVVSILYDRVAVIEYLKNKTTVVVEPNAIIKVGNTDVTVELFFPEYNTVLLSAIQNLLKCK